MTTKEYVIKYSLDKTNQVSQDEFIADFTSEFMALLEVGKGNEKFKGFENAARAIKMKWDAVSVKTAGGLSEKLWSYFNREVIFRMKYELFPKEVEKQEAEAKQKQEYQEQRHRWAEEAKQRERRMFDGFYSAFVNAILRKGIRNNIHYEVMGLPETATAEDVKKKYKELALTHHPDRGGKHEDFIRITEAKNKLLAILEN